VTSFEGLKRFEIYHKVVETEFSNFVSHISHRRDRRKFWIGP